jgi:hypothetical protein
MAFWFRYLAVSRDAEISPPDPSRKVPLYDPGALLERLNRTFRRRLSDRVEDIFNEACMLGDLETAADLLTTFEKMHERRVTQFGGERRIDDVALVKAREELARRKLTRGLQISSNRSKQGLTADFR